MQINLDNIDREQFMVHSHLIQGYVVYLVQPTHIDCSWTRENEIFRSSLWDGEGNLISASWKKFVNWGEKPDIFPVPKNINECKFIVKEDGSTLIFSLFKGNLIIRTRGTTDARNLDNGHEIDLLLEKYPSVVKFLNECAVDGTTPFSMVFEWVSSENVIVLKYVDTPDIILTGIIDHDDYSYYTQNLVERIANDLGLKRPRYHTFESLDLAMKMIPGMDQIEGFCVYHDKDQQIHKIKTETYLKLHRFKSNANIDTVVDLFFSLGMPSLDNFSARMVEQFDHECMVMIREFMISTTGAWLKVKEDLNRLRDFISDLSGLSRKDAALRIIARYGSSGWTSIAFNLLDGRELSQEHLKKLLHQCLILENSTLSQVVY